MQSMGVGQAEANCVFILPTPPKGHYKIDAMGHVGQVNTQSIIEQDGNHWRKILTIMAKLCFPDKLCPPHKEEWRDYRDNALLQQRERIVFEVPSVFSPSVWYFICGGEMQAKVNKQLDNLVYLNEKKSVSHDGNVIFCPYLDYRQFPNTDIELTRAVMMAHAELMADKQ